MQVIEKKIEGDLIKPEQLMLLADKVVRRYTYLRAIPSSEMEDVKMAMVEKYLVKADQIWANFSEKASTKTYVFAILNRICCEIIRKESKHWKILLDNELLDKRDGETGLSSTEQNILLQDEVKYLSRVLNLFLEERIKIEVFLRYYYRIKIPTAEMKRYYCGKDKCIVYEILREEGLLSKGLLFVNIAKLISIVEKKKLLPDSIRMWLYKNIDSIIFRMNNPFNRANYDRGSFKVLFDYYCIKNRK